MHVLCVVCAVCAVCCVRCVQYMQCVVCSVCCVLCVQCALCAVCAVCSVCCVQCALWPVGPFTHTNPIYSHFMIHACLVLLSMSWMQPDTPHLQQKEAEEMERVLKECTKELQQKDSILEPTTARTLEQFVQVGGTLEDAVDLMVGSFADLPTSLNKMMELLHLSGTY